ncbi:MAG: tRNA 2-thiouridine(34) synthase MnmA [Acidobacteria bacterium]|nr:tRNA 2-thiouridine(34) synthase MnmA [Acidobacteriota bacterium]
MSTLMALSGGVDSSVAAWLLSRDGHDLIGVSMQLWDSRANGGTESRCCSPGDFRDARRVAGKAGFPYYILDYEQEFSSRVVKPFMSAYLNGETPNPCVECNRYLKFGALLDTALRLGAERLATGHYARIDTDPHSGLRRLRRARDLGKDQSYFLYNLGQAELQRVLFPLGGMLKSEVRRAARQAGLDVADKPESQDLCFLGSMDRLTFMSRRGEKALGQEGAITTVDGHRIGTHLGLVRYTVGQRKALGNLPGGPWYVCRIDAEENRLVVGREQDLCHASLEVADVSWVSGRPPSDDTHAGVRIRHAHHPSPAVIRALPGGRAQVKFTQPQRAITPGQAAVFYDGDIVLGGGRIERTTDA